MLLSPSPSVNRAASFVPLSVGTAFFVLLWGGAFTSSSCVVLRNPCLFGVVLLVVLLFSTHRVGGALFFTCFSCGVAFVFLPFMGGAASLLPLSCFLSPKLVDLMDVKKMEGMHHRKKAASLPSGLVLHYPSLFLFQSGAGFSSSFSGGAAFPPCFGVVLLPSSFHVLSIVFLRIFFAF